MSVLFCLTKASQNSGDEAFMMQHWASVGVTTESLFVQKPAAKADWKKERWKQKGRKNKRTIQRVKDQKRDKEQRWFQRNDLPYWNVTIRYRALHHVVWMNRLWSCRLMKGSCCSSEVTQTTAGVQQVKASAEWSVCPGGLTADRKTSIPQPVLVSFREAEQAGRGWSRSWLNTFINWMSAGASSATSRTRFTKTGKFF